MLDVPLMENSGALDAVLVVISDDDENSGSACSNGVFRNDDGGLTGDGCTVTFTRGVTLTGDRLAGTGVDAAAGLTLHLMTKCAEDAPGLAGAERSSESVEFSSWPNERDSSEKAPELEAFEPLRGRRLVVGDDVDLLSRDGGTRVDDVTIALLPLEIITERGFGAVVVPIVFDVEDNKEDTKLAGLVIEEAAHLLVLS